MRLVEMMDPVGFKIAVAAASAVSGAAAVATRDLSVAYLGVPLPVVLAAFAGAGLILSFLPRRVDAEGSSALEHHLRTFGTIVLCMLLGSYGAALLPRLVDGLAGGELFIAFALGALGQIFVPLAIERRLEVWTSITSWLPRRSGSGSNDGGKA
mgnify:CR=1 FL=1